MQTISAFKNLFEIEEGVTCYINYIDNAELSQQLSLIEVGRDAEITKLPSGSADESVVFSYGDGQLTISRKEAEDILIRVCEICWSCGQCELEP